MSALCAWARVCLCVIGKGFWACTCLCGCVCALVCGECMWRPEVNMGCLQLFFIYFTFCFVFCMCMSVWSRVCQSECVKIRGQSDLLPCGLLESHSGHQARWQGPSPIELSHFSSTLHFWDRISYLTGNLLVQLDWLASESPGLSCEGNPDVYHCALLFMLCWGPDLGHSRSHLLLPSVCVWTTEYTQLQKWTWIPLTGHADSRESQISRMGLQKEPCHLAKVWVLTKGRL